jgi:hypothetical protein
MGLRVGGPHHATKPEIKAEKPDDERDLQRRREEFESAWKA